VPASALLLVLFAAICHTTWNLLLKRDSRRLETQVGALAWGVVLASPVLAVYSVRDVSPMGWALIVASAVFETGYVFALTSAYAAGDLSLVYPVARGSAALAVVPLAILVLGERPSLSGLAGIALVVAGVFGGNAGAFRRAPLAPGRRRALALALLTGSMTAGYSLVNKVGVGLMPVPLYAYLVFAINVTCVYLILWGWRGTVPAFMGAGLAKTVAMGAMMLAAYLSVLTAMSMAPVSYVVAAREIGVVVAALLGMLVLREPRSPSRLLAAVVIFSGLVVIAISR
jgi:drug/metabolite transporter (DMT)-like permease